MKKSNLLLVLILMFFSAFSQAEQALTKELITSFQKMSEQWRMLESQYPELSASLDDIDLSQPDKIISQLKSSKAYPQIKSILANYDFETIEEYYGVAVRVMGGMMGYQMKNLPEGMDIDSAVKMLKQSIAQMKASNAPDAMIDNMKNQLADMEKNIENMKAAMVNASAEDIKFISENAEWVMSVLGEQ